MKEGEGRKEEDVYVMQGVSLPHVSGWREEGRKEGREEGSKQEYEWRKEG